MIGKRIQKLRSDKGLSLSELADKAGVAKSYLSAIERDIQDNPSIHVLEKLAGVLGVAVSSLIETQSDDIAAPETLDAEWTQLVRDAMASGIPKEQFRDFLEYTRWRQLQEKNTHPKS
ncbi:helix-turn-helix domain-containing protein [Alicyclobacillaceae bacterium I2511]|jgi:XRE family transcriptional regulator of biofilm formation|nr:helix-turn-helix domain-containing protein [Alicyclobacillaceae bacterium I2511]